MSSDDQQPATEPIPSTPNPPGASGDRRRIWIAAAAVGAVLIAGTAIAATRGGDDGERTNASATTSSQPTATSSTTSSSTPTSETTTSVTSPTTGTTPGKQTSPAPEPKCVDAGGGQPVPYGDDWQGQWQTKPEPNDPVKLRICVDDITPAVGQTVTLHLVADDPDAVIVDEECGWIVEWETPEGNLCRDFLIPSNGPRPVPTPEPGHVDKTFTHVYQQAGDRPVTASVTSSRYEGFRSPYGSDAEASIQLKVHR